MLIDTHTHLYSEDFKTDLNEVYKRAKNAGVDKFFLPAIDASTHEAMIEVENKFADCYAMIGLHPCSVYPDSLENELHVISEYLKEREFCAIGEIGIDLYWEKAYLSEQKMAFAQQIDWAKERQLPFVIHCRDAFNEVFEVLESKKSEDLYGIFHCFSGNLEQAKLAISYGLKLGIGGVVTFKNGKIDQFLNEIPLEHIVLETDSPYLAPVPYRGKRNESSYLVEVVEKLCSIYQLSPDEIAAKTTENAKNIFKTVF